jgi:hypothetical protein
MQEDRVPERWQQPIRGVVEAIALQAAGDTEFADDMATFLQGAASDDGPNGALLMKFSAVLRGERGESLTKGLSDNESLIMHALLDRLRNAGLLHWGSSNPGCASL